MKNKAYFKRLITMLAQNKINITRMSGYISLGQFALVAATWLAVSTALTQWWYVLPIGVAVVAVILAAGRAEINAGVLEAEQKIYFNAVPQVTEILERLERIEAKQDATQKHELSAVWVPPKEESF